MRIRRWTPPGGSALLIDMTRPRIPLRTGSAPAPVAVSAAVSAVPVGRLTQRRVIDHGTVHSAGCPQR
jgi:hypothetical protein